MAGIFVDRLPRIRVLLDVINSFRRVALGSASHPQRKRRANNQNCISYVNRTQSVRTCRCVFENPSVTNFVEKSFSVVINMFAVLVQYLSSREVVWRPRVVVVLYDGHCSML